MKLLVGASISVLACILLVLKPTCLPTVLRMLGSSANANPVTQPALNAAADLLFSWENDENDDKSLQNFVANHSALTLDTWNGITLLHLSCALGLTTAVRTLLIARKLDNVNSQTMAGQTCLSLAVEFGHSNLVDLLSSAGPRSPLVGLNGITPIHLLAMDPQGRYRAGPPENVARVLTALQRMGFDINAVEQTHDCRSDAALDELDSLAASLLPATALQFASQAGDSSMVKMLLQIGARASLTNLCGGSPLMMAAAANMTSCVTQLLADDSLASTQAGFNALHAAAYGGMSDGMVKKLVDAGLSVNSVSMRKLLPLHLAAAAGHGTTVAALLKYCGNNALQQLDTNGRSPLDIACLRGKEQSAVLLIDAAVAAGAARVGLVNSCLQVAQSDTRHRWEQLLRGPEPEASAQSSQNDACNSRRILNGVSRSLSGPPPPVMPPDLVWAYTRCGVIPTGDMYIDDSRGGRGSHYKFGKKELGKLAASAEQLTRMPRPSAIGSRGWLAQALADHADMIKGARVVVFGSMQPVVEMLILAYGAANVTTIEYNLLTYDHPSIVSVTPSEVASPAGQAQHYRAYDIALSISSFDHDGLGRYGDPVCPDCDLLAVDRVAEEYLAPMGPRLLLMTQPVGPDVVVWNLHRRYGRIRLPLLLDADNGPEFGVPPGLPDCAVDGSAICPRPRHWHILSVTGWSLQDANGKLENNVPWTKSYEPVWVMRAR